MYIKLENGGFLDILFWSEFTPFFSLFFVYKLVY